MPNSKFCVDFKSDYGFFPFVSSVNMIDVNYYQGPMASPLPDAAIFSQLPFAIDGIRSA